MSSGYCVSKMIKISLFFMELYKNNGRVAFFSETQCMLVRDKGWVLPLPMKKIKVNIRYIPSKNANSLMAVCC